MKRILAATALAIAGFLVPTGSALALIVNGSFEDPDRDYAAVPPDAGVTGWSVASGLSGYEHFRPTTYIVGALGAAQDGLMAVDLNYVSAIGGGIEQTFATTPSVSYDVTFWGGTSDLFGRTGTGTIYASAGSVVGAFFPVADTGTIDWVPFGFTFTALGATTTLSFYAVTDSNTEFAFIDNVAVAAVPEPGTYALMLAGLAMLGFIGRRRMSS